jgi:hypothetical protein
LCYSQAVRRVRRHLSWLASAWLLGQLGAFALSPVALHADAVARDAICTCTDGGPNHMCPMHHHDAPADAAKCAMRSTFPSADARFLSVIGAMGIMPLQAASVPFEIAFRSIPLLRLTPIARAAVPDLPPPRL